MLPRKLLLLNSKIDTFSLAYHSLRLIDWFLKIYVFSVDNYLVLVLSFENNFLEEIH